jgi:hypothetical protein
MAAKKKKVVRKRKKVPHTTGGKKRASNKKKISGPALRKGKLPPVKKKYPDYVTGRPTVYDAAVLKKAQDYIFNFSDYGHVVPMVAGLARVLGVARETLYAWSKEKDKQEFSDIMQQIMSEQEIRLASGGLLNVYNSTITKAMLGKHGYHDTQKTDLSSSDGSMSPKSAIELTDEQLSRIALGDGNKG